MTKVIEDGGRMNMYAVEPQMQVMENVMPHNEKAEKLNGRLDHFLLCQCSALCLCWTLYRNIRFLTRIAHSIHKLVSNKQVTQIDPDSQADRSGSIN